MKTKLLILLSSVSSILLPIQPLFFIIGLLVALDTIIGSYACIKIHGRKSFKSHKLFNIGVKSFLYSFTILNLYLIDRFVFGGTLFGFEYLLSKSITLVFSYIELLSIEENYVKLGGRRVFDIIKEMIKKFKAVKQDLDDSGIIEDIKNVKE
jgi:hypothetical protein